MFFYRNQTSMLASTKVCWRSHGQEDPLQPYAQVPLRTVLLQVLPYSDPPDLLASEKKKVKFRHLFIPYSILFTHAINMTRTLALWNAYPNHCVIKILRDNGGFCICFPFLFSRAVICIHFISNSFVYTYGTELHSFQLSLIHSQHMYVKTICT